MTREEFVFIGPVGAGKTTVGSEVARALGVPLVELDEIAMPYYEAAPSFDANEYNRLMEHEGFVAAYRDWEPALAFAVERVVEDHRDCVFDLGAGHTSFLDRALHSRVRAALAP